MKPTKIVYSDALASACGCIITLEDKAFSHQNWSLFERSESSTFGELTAVFFSLDAFATDFRSHTVFGFTDNQNVVSIINYESKVNKLQPISLQIFSLMLALRHYSRFALDS